VPFGLSDKEFQQIRNEMDEVDVVSSRDSLVAVTSHTPVGMVAPHPTHNSAVQQKVLMESLHWDDAVIAQDPKAIELRE